jgi:hypothetical protein
MRFAAGDTSQWKISDTSELPEHLKGQEYNRSTLTLEALGRVAMSGQLGSEAGRAARENVKRDLDTSLAEMFENDETFRGGFEIGVVYDYPIIDGKVHYKTADGVRSMLSVTEDGAAVSAAAAKADPLMAPQAARDNADTYNAAVVDEMASGRRGTNTRLVVSRDLGEIIQPGSPYRKLYTGKGYRDGLSFLQLYYAEGDKLTAGTFSVDGVSDEVFDAVLARHHVVMPERESRHNSVKYGVELNLNSKADAIAFAQQFRRDCYALQRDTRVRRSATQFIQERRAEIDGYIDALVVPLSLSIHSGRKDKAIHDFVGNLLGKPQGMDPEVVRHLRAIYGSDVFSGDDGRFMSGITLYAIAEALYEGAKRFVQAGSHKPLPVTHGYVSHNYTPHVVLDMPLSPEQINRQLAGNVHAGVEAGRKHSGGCPGEVALGSKAGEPRDPANPQGAFGGREGEDKELPASDSKGKLSFTCPNPHCRREIYRFYNQLETKCKHCRKEIPKC